MGTLDFGRLYNWIKKNILDVELNALHVIALIVLDLILSVAIVKKIPCK